MTTRHTHYILVMALLTHVTSRIMSPSEHLQESSDCHEAAKMEVQLLLDCEDRKDLKGTEEIIISRSQTICNKTCMKPSCCRKLIHEFEKELTFHPKLNPSSLKIANHKRCHQPLLTRLTKGKGKPSLYDEKFTFSPKLNAMSIKLAQERAEKIDQVQARAATLAALNVAEAYSEYTFKPNLLSRSIHIAEKLNTDFLGRQKLHVIRRQQLVENIYNSPPAKKPANTKIQPPSFTNCVDKNNKQLTINDTSAKQVSRKIRKRSQTAPISTSFADISSAAALHNKAAPLKHSKSISEKPILNNKTQNKTTQNKSDASTKPVLSQECQGLLQVDFKSLNGSDRVKRIKVMAEKVIRGKKIFQIKGGYQTVRKALKSRGWVEVDCHQNIKKSFSKKEQYNQHSDEDSSDCDSDSDNDYSSDETQSDEEENEEYLMLSRAVKNCEPNFIWSLRRSDVSHNYLKKDQTINHFSGALFTTKFGLCSSLKDLRWYGDTDPSTFFPRCYYLSSVEDKEAFTDDYQFTTVLNVLKIVACESNHYLDKNYGPVSEIDSRPNVIITSPNNGNCSPPSPQSSTVAPSTPSSSPQVPKKKRTVVSEDIVHLSIKAGEYFLAELNHDDIENSKTNLFPKPKQDEWAKLLAYYKTLKLCNSILYCSFANATKAEELLMKLSYHCPQLSMDGIRNTWIIKPGAMSRGRGIVCMDNLDDILNFVQPSVLTRDNRWVIQKYIERPLLIYSTKFDIRQWFLVTDWNPLTMWMYKDCYIRFSSQLFSLKKLDKSIHLCNNSIQKNLSNSQNRDSKLPAENMWDSNMFQSYLESINEKEKWMGVIYPGMKQAIINVLLVAQDGIVDRKNTFELYGADFMIAHDYNPWLIEVNCSPTMERSTSVTKKLCKNVMEDTIKVVVDRKSNKNCDIGQFELAYKQTKLDSPPYVGLQLYVEGSAIKNGALLKPRNCTLSLPTVGLH